MQNAWSHSLFRSPEALEVALGSSEFGNDTGLCLGGPALVSHIPSILQLSLVRTVPHFWNHLQKIGTHIVQPYVRLFYFLTVFHIIEFVLRKDGYKTFDDFSVPIWHGQQIHVTTKNR
jgi:hypothetical protein